MRFSALAYTGTLIAGLAVASCSSNSGTANPGSGGSSSSGGASSGGANGSGGLQFASGGSSSSGGSPGSGGEVASGGMTDSGTGGGNGSGGMTTVGGGMGTAGAGTGGAALGGASGSAGTGGVKGSGGSGVGGGATAGSSGALPTITSTMFGDFNNAFMVTACQSAGTGYDCPNLPMGVASCPQQNWTYGSVTITEPTGNTYAEVFTVNGGDPNKIYDVTVHLLGQAEGRTYTGGTRALTANADPNAASNNLLYTGGQPGTTRNDYNVFQLTIAPPTGGTAVSGAATYYAFNAVDTSHEGNHYNYSLDETFTIKVKTGFVVTLTSHDSNCIAIKNCGPGGPYGYASATDCESHARTISGVTLPATFRGQPLASGGAQPFQTQFLNFKVTTIVAE